MRQEWNGLWVCAVSGTRDCWEERHPQDFVRGRKEDITVKDARPLVDWIPITDSSPAMRCVGRATNGVAGDGKAGCAITGIARSYD